jgi:hypothetical protein
MNALLGMIALPTAATAVDAAQKTAAAVAKPFDLLLQVATAAASNDDPAVATDAEDSDSLESRVGKRLQQILETAGIGAGEPVRLNVNSETGEIDVADNSPLAAAIEEALRSDSQLAADLCELARAEGMFRPSVFLADSQLEVELGEGSESAAIHWL